MRRELHEFLTFDDRSLSDRWTGKRVPISDVYEAYIAGRIDIAPDQWVPFFEARYETMTFRLTESHFKWALTNFLPEVALHSKRQDARIVGDHYDRGNDFFAWFLGESMVYTAAWFEAESVPLDQAQYAKIARAAGKLRLTPGERLLDVGCGWGTFVAQAARDYGVNARGVTLAKEQVAFGTQRISDYGVSERARVEVRDYRNISGRFDKIVSLEMVEHVGIKNLPLYFRKVHELLQDDGLFVVQWTGIRNLYSPRNPLSALSLRPEDLFWGLFMNRYIFAGADASLPLSGMLRAAEDAGFETADVERMSSHYVLTLRAWRDLWVRNRAAVTDAYGERWYRLWVFFLYWSALIGEQGSAMTYQVLLHKNHERFDRRTVDFHPPSDRAEQEQ